MNIHYNYDLQAWVQDGKIVPCNHPASMDCKCYAKLHAGEEEASIGLSNA